MGKEKGEEGKGRQGQMTRDRKTDINKGKGKGRWNHKERGQRVGN